MSNLRTAFDFSPHRCILQKKEKYYEQFPN